MGEGFPRMTTSDEGRKEFRVERSDYAKYRDLDMYVEGST